MPVEPGLTNAVHFQNGQRLVGFNTENQEPSREYELVNVSGVQAKYWPNLVSEEEAYIDSTAGAQFSARIDYGIERTAVLMWEDLETNTIFRLRGVLSKEDILYMAESMTRSEKSNKT